MVIVFRIIFIIWGVILLLKSFTALVKKHMTEGFSLGWALGSVFFIIIGVFPELSAWMNKLSTVNMILLILLGMFLLGFVMWISIIISELMMKSQELAMQVSLLNQENEKIMTELKTVSKKLEKLEQGDQSKEG